ncbi:hypothetical protein CLAIMM_07808, partial [Cladophialophora immunda]
VRAALAAQIRAVAECEIPEIPEMPGADLMLVGESVHVKSAITSSPLMRPWRPGETIPDQVRDSREFRAWASDIMRPKSLSGASGCLFIQCPYLTQPTSSRDNVPL